MITFEITTQMSNLSPTTGTTPAALWKSTLDGALLTSLAADSGLDLQLDYQNATIVFHTARA